MSESVMHRRSAPLQTSELSAASSAPTGDASVAAAAAAADAVLVAAAAEAGVGTTAGVAEWLAGRSVLLTGATGFLGQLLMEKILRSCPDVAFIYLLVRDKRGVAPERRVDKLLDDPLFERARVRRDRLVLVNGDMAVPGLGLSAEDRQRLLDNVSVVLHCAATVRFDESLRVAANINVRAAGEVVRLAREMPQLQAIVHMSTAYAPCPNTTINEIVYEPRMRAEQLLNIVDALDDDALDRITPVLMDKWPNTYCFTKAIAEEFVMSESKGLPLCIFRPSMVIGTSKEPMPGWINNVNGPIGLVMGAAVGILRTVYIKNLDSVPDIIPGDYVTNAVLAAAWKTANNKDVSSPVKTEGQDGDFTVYNCVSSSRRPISWRMFLDMNEKYGFNYPSEHCIWYYFILFTSSTLIHKIHRIFLHLLPALIVDTFLRISGRKPMLWRAYKKIHKFMDLTAYFGLQQWTFLDNNMQWLWNQMSASDKETFPFNIEEIDWEDTIKNMIPGLRQYFLKDPLHTVEKAKIKYNRLKMMHYFVVGAFWLLLFQLLWWIISFVW